MNRQQRQLFMLLCLSVLFSGFAGLSLSQTMPNWRVEFGLSREQTGRAVALINIGQVLSYLLVHLAGRWGRRPIFLLTLVGYPVMNAATAFMPDVFSFGVLQLLTRVFTLATLAVGAIIAAEELPAKNRGLLVGVVVACAALGAVFCAALVPFLSRLFFGWRTVYLLSGIALLLFLPSWRAIRETEHFLALRKAGTPAIELWSIWRSARRVSLLRLAAIWFLTNLCAAGVVLFWKEFALAERALRETQIGAIIASASLLGIPGAFFLGSLSDRIGRRRAAVIVYAIALLGITAAFTLWSPFGLACGMLGAICGSYALPGILDTITAESFSTQERAAAFAWANTFFGRAAFIAAPLLIGELSQHIGWGPAVLSTLGGPIIALLLLLRVRETAGGSL